MPLEHFKTQVLLLHSEQSKLDVLRSGLNDRYAVHCATSGTEALNIFGDTPIHVIVSAQDLPGMSGVDALREAKKRSPETIAILLAGTDASDGLEALVGDKEVFQVVRGEISADALENLIDSATKSVRLLALSEASNDTAANVDEAFDEPFDDSEHIVMETADNGSFIISDGTGTVPVLKPNKIQVAPSAGGQAVDVLVMTKDEEFLGTIRESSRGMHHVHHATNPNDAQRIAQAHAVGVLVTDASMVGSNIEALTNALRAHAPRMVAIVAGHRDDGELLMDLINRGHVYRFLLKPVSPGRARLAIEASVKHHLESNDGKAPAKPAAPAQAPKARQAARQTPPAAAPKAGPKGAAKQQPVITERRAPATKPSAPARQATDKPQPKPTPTVTQLRQPLPKPNPAATGSFKAPDVPHRLDDAFEEAPSFTDTVVDLAATVSKSLSSAAESVKGRAKSASPASAPTEPPNRGRSKMPIAIGVAAVAVVAVAIGFLSGEDEPETVTTAAPSTEAPREQAPAPAPQPAQTPTITESEPVSSPVFDSALQQARAARASGNLYTPIGENAVELYMAALDLSPQDPEAQREFEEALAEVFSIAETALLEDRADDAGQALEIIALADPDNPRLTFLDAQLTQQQFRQLVANTRTAIRDARFEDAQNLLAQAEQVPGANGAEIDALNSELAEARSEQRLDDVLQAAAARLNADQLIAPANDNARYYYQLALNSEPGNAAAQQGLIAIANKLVLRARVAIDDGNYAVAESLLAEAGALDANSAELSSSLQALQAARNEASQAAARAEAQRQAAAAAEAARIQREREAQEAARLEAERVAREAQEAEQAEAAPPTQAAAVREPQSDNGRPPAAAASAAEAEAAEPEVRTVAISDLKRTTYVPPRYPRSAQRRNASGHVDVMFTVNATGAVENIEITDSEPGTTFDSAAIEAVEQWEFEPLTENGAAVPSRVGVRLSFALQ